MGEVRFAAVRGRAFREARAEVRLDSPVRIVTGVISPFASAAIVWWATGSWGWGGIAGVGVLLCVLLAVFAIKLFTVPVAMANEAYAERDKIGSELGEKMAALEARIAALTAPAPPPPRNPDDIYQHGELVGNAVGARRIPNAGIYHFDQINDQGHFDGLDEFEYREWVLQTKLIGAETKAAMSGAVHHSYLQVQARIIRRR